MLKVLIVEDELLTRIGIESMIKWEENGFTVVGIAEDGRHGLELAMEHRPDIILTDVKMPGMNGIELIKALKNTDFSPQFLVLSGYNEYQYVREALKLGAVDYILKLDIEPELLLNLLNKMKTALNSRNTLPDSVVSWNEQSTVIYKLIRGRIVPDDVDRILRQNNIEIPEKNLVLVMSRDFSGPGGQPQECFYPSSRTILMTLNELLQHFGKAYGCSVRNTLFFNILSFPDPMDIERFHSFKAEIEKVIDDFFRKTYNIPMNISFSELSNTFSLLNKEYNKIIERSSNMQSSVSADNSAIFLSKSKNVLNAVKQKDANAITLAFSDIIDCIPQYNSLSRKFLYGICLSLINEIDLELDSSEKKVISWRIDNRIAALERCSTQLDFISFLTSLKNVFTDLSSGMEYSSGVIEKSIEFIKRNYQDPDLDLAGLAAANNVSPNHLCKIFSKELSTSPIQYLTRVRVDNSKHYLKTTGKQIKEISNLVGYNNSYYFSRLFKKVTGLTPKEFREK